MKIYRSRISLFKLKISLQIHTAVNNYSAIQTDPLIFLINVTR